MRSDLDETHDPARTCWVAGATDHPLFPVQNLPFGIFVPTDEDPRAGTAIGESILDLRALARANLLPAEAREALQQPTLNALFALQPAARRALRRRLSALLSDASQRDLLVPWLHPASHCTLQLPATIGDYSDFYVGIHHAMNVGRLYRPDAPLMPNYKHVPIGYHGRASSVRPSGTPVVRPHGQIVIAPDTTPRYLPSRELDYEVELGIWIGGANPLGDPIPIGSAAEHIVGLCVLNDWSARDIQAWERLPLGPFLSKSFQTNISPWVVTREALAPFRMAPTARPSEDPTPLPYLTDPEDREMGQFSLALTASLRTPQMRESGAAPCTLSRSSASDMYWTYAQIVTQQASNGCNLNPGDLLGTGTLSGASRGAAGSLLELSRAAAEPVQLPNGESRSFLHDGDEVILAAIAAAPGFASIGVGVCTGIVLPAR